MKSLLDLLSLSLFAVTVAAVAPAPAAAAAVSSCHHTPVQPLPITMAGAGLVAGNPTAPGGAPFTASGVASHLGAWANTGTLAIDPATGAATGSVAFVAANGDRLDGTFDGTFDPASGTATATFRWTGGTGRFANASGDAGFVVRQDPSGSFTFAANGTVIL